MGPFAHPGVLIMHACSCSIVDFTQISASLKPMQVCDMLNELYEKFDSIIDVFPEVWKADVIGDS